MKKEIIHMVGFHSLRMGKTNLFLKCSKKNTYLNSYCWTPYTGFVVIVEACIQGNVTIKSTLQMKSLCLCVD